MTRLNKNIKIACIENDISMNELCAKLGFTTSSLQRRYADDDLWKISELKLIAELTGTTVGKLLGE
jgi:hypothetical protein